MAPDLVLERFGKSSEELLALKRSFFDENDALVARAQRFAALYAQQPLRTLCMACAGDLDDAPRFTKLGVDYAVCPRCTHVNGVHVDSDAYAAEVYTSDGGAEYAVTYSAESAAAFALRTRAIYLPKAAFLFEALAMEEPAKLVYADLGAGSGYFVAALLEQGAAHVSGWEPSEAQVEVARQMVAGAQFSTHELDEIVPLAQTVEADVVSLIGVLEHLQRPREVLAALVANPRVRYVYISVPLFSATVLLEAAFPDVFPRQLSCAHTHLFTDSSLARLEREFGLERCAAWWFGSDIPDLYRSLAVTLGGGALRGALDELLLPAVDELQAALDRRRTCSEVHLLWRAG